MRSPTEWKLPIDRRFGLLVFVAVFGCAYPTDEFADGGSDGPGSPTGGKNSSSGGSVNPGSGGGSSGGHLASGGAATGGHPASGGASSGGHSASGGAPGSGGGLGTGGAATGGVSTGGGASGTGGRASGGAASSGGAVSVGGTVGAGGATAGGAPGAGGGTADPSCTCDLEWVEASSIPAQNTGDCMGYMDMLYRYEPENVDQHMTYCDPNCPPPTSGSENCKWHAKLVLEGPCP